MDLFIVRIAKNHDIAALRLCSLDEVAVTVKIGQNLDLDPRNARSRDAVAKFFNKKMIAD